MLISITLLAVEEHLKKVLGQTLAVIVVVMVVQEFPLQ